MLAKCVRACGRRWELVRAAWLAAHQRQLSESALRQRWSKLAAARAAGTESYSDGSSDNGRDVSGQVHARIGVALGDAAGTSGGPSSTTAGAAPSATTAAAPPPGSCTGSLQLVAQKRHQDRRRSWSGRGWVWTLQSLGPRVVDLRPPLDSHAAVVRALLPPQRTPGVLFVNAAALQWRRLLAKRKRITGRADAAAAMARGLLAGTCATSLRGARPGPTEPLPTLVRSAFRAIYVRSTAGSGYLTAEGVAAVLGTGGSPHWRAARRILAPRDLMAAVGDSTARVMIDALVTAALSLVGRMPRVVLYASLYSGAFDTVLPALDQMLPPGSRVEAVAAAERSAKRRAVLRASGRYVTVYSSTQLAVTRIRRKLHAISWTAPCSRYSRAALIGASSPSAARRRAVRSMLRQVGALARLVERTAPMLVVGEQVDGLKTHFPVAWEVMWAALVALPYTWSWAIADAADLGCCSHRRRVLLAGVRVAQTPC